MWPRLINTHSISTFLRGCYVEEVGRQRKRSRSCWMLRQQHLNLSIRPLCLEEILLNQTLFSCTPQGLMAFTWKSAKHWFKASKWCNLWRNVLLHKIFSNLLAPKKAFDLRIFVLDKCSIGITSWNPKTLYFSLVPQFVKQILLFVWLRPRQTLKVNCVQNRVKGFAMDRLRKVQILKEIKRRSFSSAS